MTEEIRWQQGFQNYQKALGQLTSALAQYDEHAEALIKEGIHSALSLPMSWPGKC